MEGDENADRVRPQGRGSIMRNFLLKKAQAAAAPGGEPSHSAEAAASEPVEPPKPRGRAAILKYKQEQSMRTVGGTATTVVATTSTTSTTSSPPSIKIKDEKSLSDVSRTVSEMSLSEAPAETEPVKYHGTGGKMIRTTCNYIRLDTEPERGVFEYELRFEPTIDSKGIKMKLLNMIAPDIGKVRSFDGGHCLYLPYQSAEPKCTYAVPHPVDQSNVTVTLIYKKRKPYKDCLHLFNVLFKRIMHRLLYTRIGRNFFDPQHKVVIPQHKLEILPGYVTVVDDYEGGVLLCLDTQHKVLRTQTVHDLLVDLFHACQNDSRRYKQTVNDMFIGQAILTQYNNKLYRVDDVLWDKTPKDSFETVSGPITFMEYFHKQYNITIKDDKQPLLLHNASKRVPGQAEKVDQQLCLIPELCIMTGLTDSMRNNFTLMKEVAQYTRVTPAQRVDALKKYIYNVNHSPEAKEILSDWGVKLAEGIIDLPARIVDKEIILFGGNATDETGKVDWTGSAGKNKVLYAVNLNNWAIMCTEQSFKQTDEFIKMYTRIAGPMGISIVQPKLIKIPNDSTTTWVEWTRRVIAENQDELELITFIFPTMRNDRYTAVKKICCTTNPVPSQVINSRTLNNKDKQRGIVQKIALQINCKLGGSLWSVRFPFRNWMICGIDVFHMTNKQSVGAFVSSLNDTMTRWYSNTVFQDKELCDNLKTLFIEAMEKYREANGQYPHTVVIFRDGVGNGQLKHCQQYEVEQYRQALDDMKIECKLAVIIVQKRINTRIATIADDRNAQNPPPGTVLDHTVTQRNWKDFFLVSQQSRQGTVSPTHYINIYDSTCLDPSKMQRLTYKLCHLYYNWSGTIRVPAPCQYAHKIAFLTGKHLMKIPDKLLRDRLFYL